MTKPTPKEIIAEAHGFSFRNSAANTIIKALTDAGKVIVDRETLKEVCDTMRHARVFVTSRERIKYDECLAKVMSLLLTEQDSRD